MGLFYGFGKNDQGQFIGRRNKKHLYKIIELNEINAKKKFVDARSFSCGASHTIVVTKQGELFGWGTFQDGQLGCMTFKSKLMWFKGKSLSECQCCAF